LKDKLPFLLIGVALIGAMAGGVFFLNRGSQIRLQGEIQKVRMQTLEDRATVVIVDFRFINPADYPFIPRQIEMKLETADGTQLEGMVISEPDARRMFDYYKMLGPKYNESFIIREKVVAKQSLDRMLAARFEAPENLLAKRKSLRIRVEDVDGAVTEIVEAKK
jgi:hypothetical protein